jgi:hypothetical protein
MKSLVRGFDKKDSIFGVKNDRGAKHLKQGPDDP